MIRKGWEECDDRCIRLYIPGLENMGAGVRSAGFPAFACLQNGDENKINTVVTNHNR